MATQKEIERLAVLETKMTVVEERVKGIEVKMDNLPDELVRRLDDKYSQREATNKRLDEMEDVIYPFKEIKKKLWAWSIGLLFGVGALEFFAFLIIRSLINGGGQ